MSKIKRILICPLDWGLGHATRCIPIIHYLLKHPEKYEPLIAAEGKIHDLLKKEFPQISIIKLKGYDISYSKKTPLTLKLMLLFPQIITSIVKEHFWLKKIIKEQRVDVVISDNRYGLWNKKITSYFITHQLNIVIPKPLGLFGLTERLVRIINYFFIEKYDACWIPDVKEEINLSGKLSHPEKLPNNAVYTGIMSRFNFNSETNSTPKYDILFIISGPEPQRGVFEEIIFREVKSTTHKILIVRGLPNEESSTKLRDNIQVINHLSSAEMENAIRNSALIISRPGYSTVMDLAVTKSKAVFIPTPGQTEQEYLAEQLHKKKITYTTPQHLFHLQGAISESKNYSGFILKYGRVNEWLEKNFNP